MRTQPGSEPLDELQLRPELQELVLRERAIGAGNPVATDAAFARLQAVIAAGGSLAAPVDAAREAISTTQAAGAAAATTKGLSALVLAGTFLSGTILGGGAVALVDRARANPERPTVERVANPVRVEGPLPPRTDPVGAPVPSSGPAFESPAPRETRALEHRDAGAATNSMSRRNLADEQRLVEAARSALIRGRGSDALSFLKQHRARYSATGALSEERDAVEVQALAASGDLPGAIAAARRFRRRYPASIFGAAIDDAIRE